MGLFTLIGRNLFRSRLRTSLTVVGVAVCVLAFGLLRTLVAAWYLRSESASDNRLITRNRISLAYTLPVAYREKIAQVQGVAGVGYGLWYGGVYKDKKNFFPQHAVNGAEYLDLYPEILLSEEERKAFAKERNACVVGQGLVDRFGWKLGDVVPLEGTIYPGRVELVVRGVYQGRDKNVYMDRFLFKWDYLNEGLRKKMPERADRAAFFVSVIKDSSRAAEISKEIDALFANSLAETLTETEKAMALGFVSMTGAIVVLIELLSVVIVGVILIVLSNTMVMTVREREPEFAVLKTLGFRPWFLVRLISGECAAIAGIGGIIGAAALFPTLELVQGRLPGFIPQLPLSWETLLLSCAVALAVGAAASLPSALRTFHTSIAEGLRKPL
jgi:putative ABC transport system permease protein